MNFLLPRIRLNPLGATALLALYAATLAPAQGVKLIGWERNTSQISDTTTDGSAFGFFAGYSDATTVTTTPLGAQDYTLDGDTVRFQTLALRATAYPTSGTYTVNDTSIEAPGSTTIASRTPATPFVAVSTSFVGGGVWTTPTAMAETVDGSGSFFPVLKDDGAGQQAHRGVFQFDAAKNNNFTLSVPGLAAKTGEFMRIVIMSVSDENGRVLAESENFRIGTSEAAAEVTITFNNTTHPDDNSTDSVVNYDFSQNPSRVLKVGVGYGIIVGTYSEDLFTGKFFGTSNEFGIQAAPRPIVTTPTVASITKTSATLGGNVSNGGGTAISVQGVVYALTATNSTPMIGGTGVVTVTDSTVTPGTFAVNATNLTPGTSYTFAAYATNSSGTTYSPTSSFTTVTLSALESWRQTWFGSSENTGNAADTADPYGTGVPNLAVFAFFGPAQNPATTRADNLPQMQLKGGYLVYSFTSPSGISGITYGAEWSTTLKAGSWLPITDTGTARQHIFSLPLGANGGLFMRLRVTSP